MGDPAFPLDGGYSDCRYTPPASDIMTTSPGANDWPLCLPIDIAVDGEASLVAAALFGAVPSARK
jgi:hypothetical protein